MAEKRKKYIVEAKMTKIRARKRRLSKEELQQTFWDAAGFYEDQGYNSKTAEELAWRDLEADFPDNMRRLQKKKRG